LGAWLFKYIPVDAEFLQFNSPEANIAARRAQSVEHHPLYLRVQGLGA